MQNVNLPGLHSTLHRRISCGKMHLYKHQGIILKLMQDCWILKYLYILQLLSLHPFHFCPGMTYKSITIWLHLFDYSTQHSLITPFRFCFFKNKVTQHCKTPAEHCEPGKSSKATQAGIFFFFLNKFYWFDTHLT